MSAPFPGMDPYLEDPVLWSELHHRLITYTADALNARMPSGFVARIEERVYLAHPEREVYPDVWVAERPAVSNRVARSAVALAEEADPPKTLFVTQQERREGYIEIRSARPPRRVVTVLEVLSPSNKALGSVGRRKYLEKQAQVLESDVSLVEIDLLHQGAYTLAAPEAQMRSEGSWDYLICVRRGWLPDQFDYWMASLRIALPRISIPVTEEEGDVTLNLQAVFNQCYEAGRYQEDLDYQQPPPIRLSAEDLAWMDALLREQGLRV